SAVLHALRFAPLRSDRPLVRAVSVAQPQVPVAVKRLQPAIRRFGCVELPAALRTPSRVAGLLTRRRRKFRRGTGSDIIPVAPAILLVFEGAAVILPPDIQCPEPHRTLPLLCHALVLFV